VSSYQLAVNLTLSAGGLMSGAAMAMGSFNSIKGAAEAADASVLSHQKTLDRMNYMGASQGSRSYQYALQQQGQAAGAAAEAHDKLARAQRGANMIGAGVASFGIGMAGADVLKHWITDAGALELAMNNVRLATGATSAQLDAMQHGDIKIALSNQMSLTEVETLRATAAQNNLHNIPQLTAIMPELARFAEVMKVTKNYSPEESATTGVSFAHVFSGYKAVEIAPLLDQFSRALQTTHATPNQFLTTLSGFIGLARPMYGTSDADRMRAASDSIAMTALLGNMGQGTRGGNQMRALLTSTMDTLARPNAIHNRALHAVENAGGGSFFHDGHFAGYSNMLTILNKAAQAAGDPKTAAQVARAMSTAGGASIGGLLADPLVVKLFEGIKKDVSGKGSLFSLDAAQGFVNATQVGRFNQLQANMETISALMGQKILPAVVAFATELTKATGAVIDWIDQNSGWATVAAGIAVATTALLLIGGPILIVAGAFNVLAAAGGGIMAALGLGAGGAGLAAGLAGIAAAAWPIVAVGAAIAGVVLLVTHWNDVTRFMGEFMGGLVTAFSPLVQVFHALGDLLGPLVRLGADLVGQLFSPVGSAAHSAALEIERLLGLLNSMRVHPATTGTGTGLHPLPPLVRNLPDPRVPGSTVTTLLPTFTSALRPQDYARLLPNLGSSQILGGNTIGIPSPRLAPPPPGWHPPGLGGARPSGRGGGYGIGTQTVTNHYNVTINTTSDQHARAVAREAVRELQRHESEKMRDLHRYGSLTPSGVELGFHGS